MPQGRPTPALRFHWVVNEEWAPLLEDNPDLPPSSPSPAPACAARAPAPASLPGAAGPRRCPRRPRCRPRFPRPAAQRPHRPGPRCPHAAGLYDAREGSRFFRAHRRNPLAPPRHRPLPRPRPARRRGYADAHFPLPPGHPIPGLDPDASRRTLPPPLRPGRGQKPARPPIPCLTSGPRSPPRPPRGSAPARPAPPWPAHDTDLTGQTTLAQLVWLVRHVGAVVSVDSGPMHLAAATRTPLLGLHTWSDPRKVGPWNPSSHVWKAGRTIPVSDLPAMPADWCATPSTWLPSLPADIAAWASRLPLTNPAPLALPDGPHPVTQLFCSLFNLLRLNDSLTLN